MRSVEGWVGPWRAVVLAAMLAAGCRRHASDEALTAARAAQVQTDVRAYLQRVATDVTRDGPVAWQQHFESGPDFFMAVDGQLAFPDGATAQAAIKELVRTLPHIQLQWGPDIRVDPLTPRLALVATSYNEVTVNDAGQRVEATGYCTGTVENRDGRWQFRNAHWSSPPPPPRHSP
jgi:hypothetical protein